MIKGGVDSSVHAAISLLANDMHNGDKLLQVICYKLLYISSMFDKLTKINHLLPELLVS